MFLFFLSSFIFFVTSLFVVQEAYAEAAIDVVPKRFYQATPRTYSWTVNGRTYTNNRNFFGLEIYACLPMQSKIREDQDTCIPRARTYNGNKYWDTTPVRETACNEVQYRSDAPLVSSDTRRNPETGNPNSVSNVCAPAVDQRGVPFLKVSSTFDYDSTFCSNGTQVVLSARSDPNNRECDNLSLDDLADNPRNYSTTQYTCMLYFDDVMDLTACKGSQCKTITVLSDVAYGPRLPLKPQNVCSLFPFGNGTYTVTMEAYDNRKVAYGTSSIWLTAYPTYSISGNLFVDTNKNGIKDAGEANYAGTPSISTPQGSLTRNSNGTYRIANLTRGDTTVTIASVPNGYVVTNPPGGSSFDVTVGPGCPSNTIAGASCNSGDIVNLNFGIVPVYTISGNVYIDDNKNGIKDGSEANYTGAITITTNSGTVTISGGTYTIRNLFAGAATVSYTSLPADYTLVYPLNGPPPSHAVTVGGSCNTNGARGAACSGGNITNLNFAISNLYPWFQTTCGNMRIDSGITDRLYVGNAALVTNSSCTNPGVAFSGDSPYSFGNGQISSANWIVGGTTYPETYQAISPIFSSYASLSQKVTQGEITPTDLASICTLSNCTLPGNLPHGIYRANSNVVLNAYTFPANQSYIVLINGNLTINGTVLVPQGSSVVFAVTGDIIVDDSVGTIDSSTAPSIEGIYTTNRSFIVNSAGTCTDKRLNIGGSVVVNATMTGGRFQNNRDLCDGDRLYPTISFVQRLDFLFSLPTFLRSANTYSWEAAP